MKLKTWCLLVGLLGLAIGCGRSESTTISDGNSSTTVTTSDSGAEVTIKDDKGGTIRVTGGDQAIALPDNFPKDVPIYEGAVTFTAVVAGDTMTVAWKSKDPPSKVGPFYKQQLKSNGWSSDTAIDTPDGTVVSGTKENRTLTASIGREDSGSIISISIETRKSDGGQ